jgi:thiol:disulfide interchange protein
MKSPDPEWMPFVKVAFGFALLLVLAVLAGLIALGSVHAESSFGLNIILGGLLTLAGGFAGWAFRDERKKESGEEETELPPH